MQKVMKTRIMTWKLENVEMTHNHNVAGSMSSVESDGSNYSNIQLHLKFSTRRQKLVTEISRLILRNLLMETMHLSLLRLIMTPHHLQVLLT